MKKLWVSFLLVVLFFATPLSADYYDKPWLGAAVRSQAPHDDHRVNKPSESNDTDLFYYGARYYDPGIARFITPDPITPGLDSQSLNLYAYCNNNPTTLTDPTGNKPDPGNLTAKIFADSATNMGNRDPFRYGWSAGLNSPDRWADLQDYVSPNVQKSLVGGLVHDYFLGSRMTEFLSQPYGIREYQIYQNSEEGRRIQKIIENVALSHGGGKLPGFIEKIFGRLAGGIMQKIAQKFATKSGEAMLELYPEIYKSLKLMGRYRYDRIAGTFKASIASVNNAAGKGAYDYFHFLRMIEKQGMELGAKEITYSFRSINSIKNPGILDYYKSYAKRYGYTYQEIEAGTKDGILHVILTK